jgi:hypothetical protein
MKMVPVGSYVPPLSNGSDTLTPGNEPIIAPGVRGYAIEDGNRVCVPLIIAVNEGDGSVGRFIDSLDPKCVIPCVTSARLAGMLYRRGWMPTMEDTPMGDDDVWIHPLTFAKEEG